MKKHESFNRRLFAFLAVIIIALTFAVSSFAVDEDYPTFYDKAFDLYDNTDIILPIMFCRDPRTAPDDPYLKFSSFDYTGFNYSWLRSTEYIGVQEIGSSYFALIFTCEYGQPNADGCNAFVFRIVFKRTQISDYQSLVLSSGTRAHNGGEEWNFVPVFKLPSGSFDYYVRIDCFDTTTGTPIPDDYVTGSINPYTSPWYTVNIKSAYRTGYNAGYSALLNDDSDNWTLYGGLTAIVNAPFRAINTALDFEIFGVNVANLVKVIITLCLVLFVVIVILKVVF